MADAFTDFLFKNVWANPKGDWQFPITPQRISPSNGFIATFNILYRMFNLPDNVSQFHVFQIGRYNPELLRLQLSNNNWISFQDIFNNFNMAAYCYTDEGLTFLSSDVYYTFNRDRSLMIAVRWNSNFNIDYTALENITVRFFIPTYLEQNESEYSGEFNVFSMNVESATAVTMAQNFYNAHIPSKVTIFINGYLSDIYKLAIGQSVDIIYDPVVKESILTNINNLPVFYSTLDSKYKYMFSIPPDNSVNFLGNIDFYVIGTDSNNNNTGLYIHRNNIENIRNITFSDFSILTINVQNIINSLPLPINEYTISILAIVRYSAFGLNAIDTSQRLLDLNKINLGVRNSLVSGLNSNNRLWKSAVLEQSNTLLYVQSYHSELEQFDSLDVGGYFSLTKSICDPVKAADENWVTVPPCFVNAFTAYEYNNGIMTGYGTNLDNGKYQLLNIETDKVEFINGNSTTNTSNIYYNWTGGTYSINIGTEYRVYGYNGTNWSDITSLVTSSISTTDITLNYPDGYDQVIVKNNGYILTYNANATPNINGIVITLNDSYMADIPYGVVDVFVNGYSLVNKIDYLVIGNNVIITTYGFNFLIDEFNVTIRCYGFCNSNMQPLSLDKTFVINNDQIDIEAFNVKLSEIYRPLSVIVNNELYSNQNIFNTYLTNHPISYVDYIFVTLKTHPIVATQFFNQDSQTLMNDAFIKDEMINNLITSFNQYEPMEVAIEKKYVVSAFLSQVLNNLINGVYYSFIISTYSLADIGGLLAELQTTYQDDQLWNSVINKEQYKVVAFLSQYPIPLDAYEYDFYKKVLLYYNNDRLDYFNSINNLSIVF